MHSVSYDKRRNMNANNTTKSEIFPFASTYLVALIIFKSCCLVCGVLGNLGVIIYNLYMNNNKTQSSYFVANLACADLLACLAIYPTWIAEFAMIISNYGGSLPFFLIPAKISIDGDMAKNLWSSSLYLGMCFVIFSGNCSIYRTYQSTSYMFHSVCYYHLDWSCNLRFYTSRSYPPL
jgi:hypothetical protein